MDDVYREQTKHENNSLHLKCAFSRNPKIKYFNHIQCKSEEMLLNCNYAYK